MSGLELCLIGVAALIGSAIAAIAGLGGGILLMAVLLQFLNPLEAIPIHAVICLLYTSPSPRDQRGSGIPAWA